MSLNKSKLEQICEDRAGRIYFVKTYIRSKYKNNLLNEIIKDRIRLCLRER